MSLSLEELDLVERMDARLSRLAGWHHMMERYYEGSQRLQQLGVAIPHALAKIKTVTDWPSIAVDALEERLDWLGWSGGDDLGLGEVYSESQLASEAGMAHLDALIFGTGFVTCIERNGVVQVAAQSPKNTTCEVGADGRTVLAGLIRQPLGEGRYDAELLLPDAIVSLTKSGDTWRETGCEAHTVGRVPLVPIRNRRRASRRDGRSEITSAMRFYTDEAARTLLGMGINREFYSYPQRWAMGADPSDFQNADGTMRPGWEVAAGSVWAIGRDEDGEKPEVGAFPANSPAPYAEQVRMLAQMMAGASAVPERYFGFVTTQPPSAEALATEESRLVKRAERRQAQFGAAWMEVGLLAANMRGEAISSEEFRARVAPRWRDAATPTRASTADAVTKLVGAGILPADSRVVLELLGLDDATINKVVEHRAATGPQGIAALADAMVRQGV